MSVGSFIPRPQWVVDLIQELAGPGAGGVWGAITGTLSDQTDLQTALDAKANTSAVAELARDAVGTALTAGAGITITPNDGADTITVASSITQYTNESARDAIGTALVAGGGVAIAVDDGADTITISASTSGGTLSGTSFPGSPSTNDVFRRTDRQIEYYYDGTRWLSTQLFNRGIHTTATISASTNYSFNIPELPTYDVWLVSWDTVMYRTAAGEWDVLIRRVDSTDTATTIDTQDGSADATTTEYNRARTLGQLIQTANVKSMLFLTSEISGTSSLVFSASVSYRLVG